MASPGGKLKYTSTEQGCPPPLTLAACRPGWDDYLDLGKTVTKIANRLMEEDGQQVLTLPKGGTIPKQKDVAQVMVLPPSDNVTLVSASEFPGAQSACSSRENPIHQSDATEVSVSGSHPMKDAETEDKAVFLGHFSDTLNEMAASVVDLEDGYFKALHEVIIEMEKALHDVSHIDAHYVSCVVTVMNSWQEAVQTAASHMEGVDTTIYLAHQEDARKVTKEYIAAVIQAHQEHDDTHEEEQKRWKEAIKTDDFEDPVIRLLHATRKVAHAQAEKGHRRVSCQHKIHSPEACTHQCTGAPDSKRPKHGVPISDEHMVHDRRGVHLPHAGKALRLVWLGRHHPGHSGDVP